MKDKHICEKKIYTHIFTNACKNNTCKNNECNDKYMNINNRYEDECHNMNNEKTKNKFLSNLSHIFTTRSISAPPMDVIFSDAPKNIKESISYTAFYRRNSKIDIRLPVPSYFVMGSEHIHQSLIERIDADYPFSESITYMGQANRSTTPIGNHPFLREINISEMKGEMKGEMKDDLACEENLFEKDILVFLNKESVGDVFEYCISLSMDQEGSRFVQKRLEKSTEKEVLWFFNAIKNSIKLLSLDLFGNYVVQKLLEMNVSGINDNLISFIIEDAKELSLHNYGCRVIQKVLENESGERIVEHFKENIQQLIEDQNGNHVIQKCVEHIKDRSFIIKEFEKEPIRLSKHKYGCRVVQRIFENCNDTQIYEIIKKISKSINLLIEDQYGNYVLQHIIQNKEKLRILIIEEILLLPLEKMYFYCCHKFASNVIEKCVMFDDRFVEVFLLKLNDTPLIVSMACDRFANYVVQRVIEKRKSKIAGVLKSYYVELKKSVYAKHILSKIQ